MHVYMVPGSPSVVCVCVCVCVWDTPVTMVWCSLLVDLLTPPPHLQYLQQADIWRFGISELKDQKCHASRRPHVW